MIKNILFKIIRLSLIIGFLWNLSLATEIPHDDEFSNQRTLSIAEQTNPHETGYDLEKLQKTIFSGAILLHIGSYLGRLEVGRVQQASKSIRHFFIKGKEALPLWKSFAQQLQLNIAKDINFETLRSYIKNYYISQVYSFPIPQQTLFKTIRFICFSFSKSIFAGYAFNTQNDDKITAIKLENGEITSLGYLNNGTMSKATAISEDTGNIAGSATDGPNGKFIAVKWENRQIKSLPFLNNGKESVAEGISADGLYIVGWAHDGQDNKITPVVWIKEQIKLLLDDVMENGATRICPNTRSIAGRVRGGEDERTAFIKWAEGKINLWDQCNNEILLTIQAISTDGEVIIAEKNSKIIRAHTTVLWKGRDPGFFDNFCLKEFHDQFYRVMTLSSNGSDFIVHLEDNNLYYKVHLPRYDLWKMK